MIFQQILELSGISWSSTVKRHIFEGGSSESGTAASSIPWDSTPLILRSFMFAITIIFLPKSSSGA